MLNHALDGVRMLEVAYEERDRIGESAVTGGRASQNHHTAEGFPHGTQNTGRPARQICGVARPWLRLRSAARRSSPVRQSRRPAISVSSAAVRSTNAISPTSKMSLKKAGFHGAYGVERRSEDQRRSELERRISDRHQRKICRRSDVAKIRANDLKSIKSGKVLRITFSIGSSNFGDFAEPEGARRPQGTGKKEHLCIRTSPRSLQRFPSTRSISTTRNSYDRRESTVKFALMLGGLGYHA